MENLAHVHQHPGFRDSEQKIVLEFAVSAFPGLAGKGEDGYVGIFCGRLHRSAGKGHLRCGGTAQHAGGNGFAGRVLFQVLPVNGRQRFIQRKALFLQSLVRIHHIGPMHMPRPGSARNQVIGPHPEKRQYSAFAQRQGRFPVLQQHHPLFRRLPGNPGVSLQVRSAGRPIPLERRGFHDQLQYPPNTDVQRLFSEFAPPDLPHDFPDLGTCTRLHEVAAGLDLGARVPPGGPVGHDQPLEAPFPPEDVGQQPAVLLGVNAVEPVVRGHHRPGLRLLHGYLEVPEIEPPEHVFRHPGIVPETIGFLVVGGKMLHRSAYSLALDALHIRSGHPTAQERVFREILEVAAAQRVPHQVHARGQHHVHPVLQGLVADSRPHTLDKVHVPAGGQERADRETRAVESLRNTLAAGFYTHPGGPVRQDDGRNPQPGHGAGHARCPGNGNLGTRDARKHALVSRPHHQGGLFFQGEQGQDPVYVFRTGKFFLLLSLACKRDQEASESRYQFLLHHMRI